MEFESLEIIGFKSFGRRTELNFQPGITAIVGPNGCGKSNIADAIKWVLGEQRAGQLRGDNMQDVIFEGAGSRRSSGMAEVSLQFTNMNGETGLPHADLRVTRRLYRTGESQYMINRQPCRLKDIVEIFADSGVGRSAYAILEQGRVDFILNSKPEERRGLFEAAAGIMRYRVRRREAELKLERTRANLTRIQDIFQEVCRQRNSLRRQVSRAQRYHLIRADLSQARLDLFHLRYRELRGQAQETTEKLTAVRSRLASLDAACSTVEARLTAWRLDRTRESERFEEVRSRLNEARRELDRGTTTLDYCRKSQDEERLAQAQGEVEIRNLQQSREEVHRESQTLADRLNEMEQGLEGHQDRAAQEAERLEQARRQAEEAREALRTEQERLMPLRDGLSQARSRLRELEESRRRAREGTARLEGEETTLQQERSEGVVRQQALTTRLGELDQEGTQLDDRREELEQGILKAATELEKRREERAAGLAEGHRVRSRLETLEQMLQGLEGLGEASKELAEELAREPERLLGPLAGLIEVPPRWEAAVEASLGERLADLVIRDREALRGALEHLRTRPVRTGLIPLGSPGEAASELDLPAPLLPLAPMVQAEPQVAPFITRLLARTALAPDLAAAEAARDQLGLDVVTPEGILVRADGGVVTPGRSAGSGFMAARRESRELAERAEELDRQGERLQAALTETEERLRQLRSEQEELRGQRHRLELERVELRSGLQRLDEQEIRRQKRADALAADRERLSREESQAAERSTEAEKQETALTASVEACSQGLVELRRKLTEEEERLEKASRQATTVQIEQAQATSQVDGVRRELERLRSHGESMEERLVLVREGRTRSLSRLAQLELQEKEQEKQNRQLRRSETELEERTKELQLRLDDLERKSSTAEHEVRSHRRAADEVRELDGTLREETARQTAELQHLAEQVREVARREPEELFQQRAAPAGTPEEHAARVQELQTALERIGQVNLAAEAEFQIYSERHEFLEIQQKDLTDSLEDLEEAIRKIDRTTRRRFLETFEDVRRHFKSVFANLFPGGAAELLLTDSESPLDAGVEIMVRLPGKRIQNIQLLSGGEKALTALSLLFALYMRRPSPFLFLDEVDAPLDEANVHRFLEFIRQLSGESRVILITHNHRTMEAADLLYGVTMEEQGISKLVSVKLTDLEPDREAVPAS